MLEGRPYRHAMCAHNRVLAYDRPTYDCKRGVAKFTHHTVVVFYAIGIFVLLYRPVNRLYI